MIIWHKNILPIHTIEKIKPNKQRQHKTHENITTRYFTNLQRNKKKDKPLDLI